MDRTNGVNGTPRRNAFCSITGLLQCGKFSSASGCLDRSRQGGRDSPMLAWLLALPCLTFACLASTSPMVSAGAALHDDAIGATLLQAGIASLYQAFCVSKSFSALAKRAVKSLYGIEHDGKVYLSYTKILYERDTLIQNIRKGHTVAATKMALQDSLDYMRIQSILEAEFGCCFRYADDNPPTFCLHTDSADILNDTCKVSVLPYVLDQSIGNFEWIYFIRGLVELKRFDLLEQVAFPSMTVDCFCELLGVSPPESVITNAARSLQRTEPTLELPSMLAASRFCPEALQLPKDCRIPIFLLRYLYESSIPIPEGCVLTDGLKESSFPFWMYVCQRSDKEATELLGLVLKHGTDRSRCLARAFYMPVSLAELKYHDRQVYQAMLIRFQFSAISTEKMGQNYTAMLGWLVRLDYHTACAFLECGQHALLEQFDFSGLSDCDLQAFADKMHRLRDKSLYPLMRRCIRHLSSAPTFLKLLIQRGAPDSYASLVWEVIQKEERFRTAEHYYCFIPLEGLKRLVFERDISLDIVRRMLGKLNGFRGDACAVSLDAHVLYTVMFWEAPERVISHFFDQIPPGWRLDHACVWRLLQLTKYSREFCRKLVLHLGPLHFYMRHRILEFRPDFYG